MMAEARMHQEHVEEPHGGRRASTANNGFLHGLGLRTRASRADAEGLIETSAQDRSRPPLSGGIKGDVGFYRGYLPLDHTQELDRSGRRSLEGDALPQLMVAGEAQNPQTDPRQPPSLRRAPAPPRHQRAWQSMDFNRASTVTASKADTVITTPVASSTTPHFRRHSGGGSATIPSSSFALEGETVDSWHADSAGVGQVGGFGRGVPDYRGDRRSSRGQLGQGYYLGNEPIINGHAPWAGGSRGPGSGRADNGEGGEPGVQPMGRRLQSTDDHAAHQYPSQSAPTRAKRMRDPANDSGMFGMAELLAPGPVETDRGYQPGTPSWTSGSTTRGGEHVRETEPLSSTLAPLQGAGYGRSNTSSTSMEGGGGGGAAGTDGPLRSLGASDPFRRPHHAELRPTQHGGGLASQAGRRWPGAADHNAGPGAYMNIDYGRELYQDDRRQHDSPARQQHHRHSSQPMDHQAAPMLPVVGAPGLGRGDSDPGFYSTTSRPQPSGMASSARSSYPWPGLTEAGAAAGGQEPGSRSSTVFGERHRDSGRYGGGGGVSGTVLAGRGMGQRRLASDLTPTASVKCMGEGCERRPRYAYKGSKKLAYCAAHRLVGMVDMRHPRCLDEHCTKQPSFGMEGDRRPSFCATHKKPGMINVSSRRCQQFGCIRSPNFGFPGDKRASYCKGHSDPGMVDVVSRRCGDPSCTRRPLYNMNGLRPVLCREHKQPGMIDVVSARCQEPGCLRHPSFGYASENKARRCARHRLEGMEGLKGRRQPKPIAEAPQTLRMPLEQDQD